MTSAIYQIRNSVSGRVYVGSAVNVEQRWACHRHRLRKGNHHSIAMQRSWNKHGAEVFVFEILECVQPADLIAREQYWIDALDATNPKTGFNMAPTAGNSLGRKHPPEIRAKMRAKSFKGKKRPPRTPEHCAAISAAKRGIPVPALRGPRGPNPGVSKAKKGVPNPAIGEWSRRHKGRKIGPMSEAHKQKLRDRVFSEETKALMSLAAKARCERDARERNQQGEWLCR